MPSTIAIDGPAASGKSTLARELAQALDYFYFDTGVMYRALTWVVLERGLDIGDEAAITDLARSIAMDVRPEPQAEPPYRVFAGEEDVTDRLRHPDVDLNVSAVSSYQGVRKALSEMQREIGKRGRIVMVGRDIGTVVMPKADLKLYLDAGVETRALRRFEEIRQTEPAADYPSILEAMRTRDRLDSSREHAPLRAAADAIRLDTTDLTIEQTVAAALSLVKSDTKAG